MSGPQSALKIAEFHKQHCLGAPGDMPMSKTAVDVALTLHQRVCSLPRCEEIFIELEELYGADHSLNNPSVLQEIVYRARTPARIAWMLEAFYDGFVQGHIVKMP